MGGGAGQCRAERPRAFYQGLSDALAEHAKAEFALRRKQPDGQTLRAHLRAAWNATGRKPPELEVPPLPRAARAVWSVFCELDDTRGGNGFGVDAINEARLLSWQQLHGVRLTPWEIQQIQRLDRLCLTAMVEEQKAKQPNKQTPTA